jgi:phage shock protein A
MNEVKFEEFTNMGYEEQIKHVEDKIQRVRDAKTQITEDIRKLEEYGEECNKQIETLLEMKFNVIHQQRLSEIQENVFGK